MKMRLFVVAALLLALANPLDATADIPVVLPLTLHIAERAGVPVVDDAFITARVARANEIFAPYDVQFTVTSRVALEERHAAMASRADRDALGEYFTRGTIHVFLVESLLDVDQPDRVRRGVHWLSATCRGAHYVILSSIAGVSVLAHELGHYLGNPQHSDDPGNLMSYQHTEVLPFLDTAQIGRLRRRLRQYLTTKELVPR